MRKATKTTLLILTLIVVCISAILYYLNNLPNDNYLLNKNAGTIEGTFYKTENWGFLVVDSNEHIYRFGYAPGASTDGICYGDKISVSYTYEKTAASNPQIDTSYIAISVKLME